MADFPAGVFLTADSPEAAFQAVGSRGEAFREAGSPEVEASLRAVRDFPDSARICPYPLIPPHQPPHRPLQPGVQEGEEPAAF
ncbi:hypothetical protein [Paenibacillus chitinolyticus]|uniref:hypothetical protein n=1 Tax=Paenibacillus chitinolyticus TaxID=79263 RepID=UPI00366EB39A